eukprot:2950523-Amphidinium_carterae.1
MHKRNASPSRFKRQDHAKIANNAHDLHVVEFLALGQFMRMPKDATAAPVFVPHQAEPKAAYAE